MLDGVVVGIVVDNVDELKSHRILVEYPVDSDDEVDVPMSDDELLAATRRR